MTPFPSFPAVLPRPPLSASTARSVDGREAKVDGKWLEDAWRTVRGMEGSWQRHREARSDAINCALQQADTVIAEAKSHADRLAMKDEADRSSFAPVSLNPSTVHAGAPQPR